MSKRVNDSARRVVVRGVGASVSPDAVQSLFARCGKIEYVRFIARRTCLVQFETPDGVNKALELNNTRQTLLGTMSLSVLLDQQDLPNKKMRPLPGNFYYVNPPKYNNYMIPTLPNFITKSN